MSAINRLHRYLESRDNVADDLFSNLIHMNILVKTSVRYTQKTLKDFFYLRNMYRSHVKGIDMVSKCIDACR